MTSQEAITTLRSMQAQIIHGKRTFGDIADLIGTLAAAAGDNVLFGSQAAIQQEQSMLGQWAAMSGYLTAEAAKLERHPELAGIAANLRKWSVMAMAQAVPPNG